MNVHVEQQTSFFHHLAPLVIILMGVLVGSFAYFYLTKIETSVERSLGSNQNSSPIIITTTKLIEPDEDTMPAIDQKLQTIIENFTKKQFATMGVYVQNLDDGSFAGVNQTTTFKAASLYKLFVAYQTLLKVDEGTLRLDQQTGYDAGDIPLKECLRKMIVISDNPCGRALRKVLDVTEKPDPLLAALGFTGTNLAYDYPTTSPADVALLFEKLDSRADLSKNSNQLLLTHLKNQQINDRIPQGLPSGTEVAHKTADLDGFAHDAGIIYTRTGNYILVIMGGPWNSDLTTVYGIMRDLTSQIHAHQTASE